MVDIPISLDSLETKDGSILSSKKVLLALLGVAVLILIITLLFLFGGNGNGMAEVVIDDVDHEQNTIRISNMGNGTLYSGELSIYINDVESGTNEEDVPTFNSIDITLDSIEPGDVIVARTEHSEETFQVEEEADISECEDLETEEEKLECYVEFALEEDDPSLCDEYEKYEECYLELALSKENPDICDEIEDDPESEFNVSGSRNNKSYLIDLKSEWCYFEAAIAFQDPDLCENIEEDEHDTREICVLESEETEVGVSIISTNSPVMAGDELIVEVKVTGDVGDEEDVNFFFAGDLVEQQNIVFESEEEYLTFDLDTAGFDEGNYNIDIRVGENESNKFIEIFELTGFIIDIVDYDPNVRYGEKSNITYNVTNLLSEDEDDDATQEIEFKVDGEFVDSKNVTLSVNETVKGYFLWDTSLSNLTDGIYTISVSSQDDHDTREIELKIEDILIRFVGYDSSIYAGEELVFGLEVEVYNETEINDTLYLEILDNQEDIVFSRSEYITLEENESKYFKFEWQTSLDDYGTYEVIASVGNVSESRDLDVYSVDDDFLEVEAVSDSYSVLEGETLTIGSYVTNRADKTNIQDITIEIRDEDDVLAFQEAKSLELAPGERSRISFDWSTEKCYAGNYVAEISSDYDRDYTNIIVDDSHVFEVDIENYDEAVVRGEVLTVFAGVTNIGEVPGEQDVELTADGVYKDHTNFTLDVGETKFEHLEWNTTNEDPGKYTLNVSSKDDHDTVDVKIYEKGFNVEFIGSNYTVLRGDDFNVDVNVTNFGEEEDTQPIAFYVDEAGVVDTENVNLNPGESVIVSFLWDETHALEYGEYSAEVSSDDDIDTTNIMVKEKTYILDDFEEYEPGHPPETWELVEAGGDSGIFEVIEEETPLGDQALYGRGSVDESIKTIGYKDFIGVSPARFSFLFKNDPRSIDDYDYVQVWFLDEDVKAFGFEIITKGDKKELYIRPNGLESKEAEAGVVDEWYRFNIKNIDWDDQRYDFEMVRVNEGEFEQVYSDEEIEYINDVDEINRIKLVFDHWGEEGAMVDDIRYDIDG